MPRSWRPVTLAMLGVELPANGTLGDGVAELSDDPVLQRVVASNTTAPTTRRCSLTVRPPGPYRT
jgi:hypothetical protein